MQRTVGQRAAHAALMHLVAEGDHDAFEALYDEFGDLVYSIAFGMLRDRGRAEEATQDAWIKVWNAAGSFKPERASVATWITTLVHRHVIDLIRRSAVRRAEQPSHEPGDEVAARVASSEDVAERAVNDAYGADIRTAMLQLRDVHRRALELAYFGGLTQSEIAGEMQKPIGTVKTYMYQGMLQLRELLNPDDATPDQMRSERS